MRPRLEIDDHLAVLERGLHVLVPIVRQQAAAPLTDVGDALVAHTGGYGRVLAIAELPGPAVANVRAVMNERRRALLTWIAATDARRRAEHRARAPIEIRVAGDVYEGIREAAYEHECDVLVVEWPGTASTPAPNVRRVVERLSARPPADLVFVRPDPRDPELGVRARRVLLPIRGGRNAALALVVAEALAAAERSALTVLHVYDGRHGPERHELERQQVMKVLRMSSGRVRVALSEVTAPHVGSAIVRAGHDYDVVVLGAFADEGSDTLVSRRLAATVRRLPGTVIVAKAADEGLTAEAPA